MSLVGNSYFESFKAGQKYVHRRGRTLTQYDNLRWTFATLNTARSVGIQDRDRAISVEHRKTNRERDDSHRCRRRAHQRRRCTTLLRRGAAGQNCDHDTSFPGDTLWAVSEILETADAPSRPDAGLIRYAITALNQREQIVCSFERTVLVKRATHWADRDAKFEQNKFPLGL